jgi:hypothetical protein
MAARGHGAGRRWAIVLALVAVLAALPSVIRLLPVSDAATSAASLRRAVLASGSTGFSGYAESAGGLSLPVSQQLSSVADLLSERTTMRVWWRGAQDNRVDVVTASGETGVHTDATGSWTWDFEADTATRADPSPLDLPAPPDLLPSSLGRRLLSEAQDRELSRIGARRVAGRDALGVRLTPAAAASSVRAVDVWVDRASGLPLEVEVSARAGGPTALDTRFLDLSLGRPAASVTAFSPPPGASIRHSGTADVLREAGRRLRSAVLPATLAGLPRREITGAPEGVGLYGSGVTLLAVAPVPRRLAEGLRGTLSVAPGAVSDGQGIRVTVGPLGLMLVDPPFGGPYVLTGTVTLDALASAAAQLPEARR